MLLLYPKTSAEKTFNFLPVLRPIGGPGIGVAVNLTGNPLSLLVDGRRERLLSGKPDTISFFPQHKRITFVWGLNALDSQERRKPILSVKKFFDQE